MSYFRPNIITGLLLAVLIVSCTPLEQQTNHTAQTLEAVPDRSQSDEPIVLAAEVGAVEEVPLQAVQKTTDQRISDLEDKMEALRQEMNLIRPAIKELISRQKLPLQISAQPTLMPEPSVALPQQHAEVTPVSQPSPQMVPATPVPLALPQTNTPVEKSAPVALNVPVKDAKANLTGPAKLVDIRVGEHPGKTRMVLDVGAKTSYSYDLDTVEKILMIDLPDAKQDAVLKASLSKSPFISSYQSEAFENGSRVIVQLKQDAKVLKTEALSATMGEGARIYFDIGQ